MSSVTGTLFGNTAPSLSYPGVPCSVAITPPIEQYLFSLPANNGGHIDLSTQFGGPSGSGSGGSLGFDLFVYSVPPELAYCDAGAKIGTPVRAFSQYPELWSPGTTTSTWPSDGVTGSFDITWTYSSASPPPQPALTVSKAGSGLGTVTSADGGIDCGGTCSHSYANGTVVTLSATSAAGSTFVGWSGAGCSGVGTCTVTMSSDQAVIANFDAVIDTTQTEISCSPVSIPADTLTTCRALVTDTSGTGSRPQGRVSFSSSPESGAFSSTIGLLPSTTCDLEPTAVQATARCALLFKPSKPGVYAITGTFDPDAADLRKSSGEAALAVTCAQAHGSLSNRLLTGLRCTNDVALAEAKCTASIAALFLPFKKLKLSRFLRKDGLLDLRRFNKHPDLQPLARVYNDLARAKIRRSAPVGYRTPKQLWNKFSKPAGDAGDAWDFFTERIPAFARSLSPSDFQNFMLDLAKVAGFGDCLDFLVTHA